MANSNAPFGLRPLGPMSGQTSFAIGTAVAGVNKNDTQAIFKGDMVKMLATGYLAQWTAGTAVSQWAGVFQGCSYVSTSQGKLVYMDYWPGNDASADVTAYYIPVQGTEPMNFVIQSNATGVVFADQYANFDVTVGTGSTVTHLSATILDVASIATTATLPLRLVGLWRDYMGGQVGAGTQTGAYNWAVVRANVAGAGATGLTT